ncbi:hypothetical protein B0T19DRAFT_419186 [Cercophora scortea]|uniref:F-box domain-containing protein n=1 Tax=Cercophora scortea TaxID=314031 RepID=A0AAE0IYW1_9PEZI|nr:hypothetical protein B0T19DRAFT_419186 [Cercophora scortea]
MTATPPARWEGLTCTQRRIKDFTLDDNLPDLGTPAETSRRHEPVAGAGALEVLPIEILHEVLLQLDLRSLTYLRLVNRRTMGFVDALPQYSDIIRHASNALRGILAIGTGSWISCKALHTSLCTARCELCGDFGGYLYLLTCKRVCFLCLSLNDVLLPLPPSHACRKFGLKRHHLADLPQMKTVPGTYSPNRKKILKSDTLVDHECARLAGINLYGSLAAMEQSVLQKQARMLEAYNARQTGRDSSGRPVRARRRPPALDPFDGQSGNPHRFVAIARVPWLDRASRRVERGFYCVGCEKSSRKPYHWRILFAADTFEEHLANCGEIRDGKHCTT